MDYFREYNIDWADLINQAEEHDNDWAGRCEECGTPLQVKSQDNGTETPDQVGYCSQCDIYYS